MTYQESASNAAKLREQGWFVRIVETGFNTGQWIIEVTGKAVK